MENVTVSRHKRADVLASKDTLIFISSYLVGCRLSYFTQPFVSVLVVMCRVDEQVSLQRHGHNTSVLRRTNEVHVHFLLALSVAC